MDRIPPELWWSRLRFRPATRPRPLSAAHVHALPPATNSGPPEPGAGTPMLATACHCFGSIRCPDRLAGAATLRPRPARGCSTSPLGGSSWSSRSAFRCRATTPFRTPRALESSGLGRQTHHRACPPRLAAAGDGAPCRTPPRRENRTSVRPSVREPESLECTSVRPGPDGTLTQAMHFGAVLADGPPDASNALRCGAGRRNP